MKVFHRIFAFLLLSLFATESFGIYRFAHFCGGEVTSESYFIQYKSCCCEEAEEESTIMSDCCKDEIVVAQSNIQDATPVSKTIDSPKIGQFNLFHLQVVNFSVVNSLFIKHIPSLIHYQFYDSSPPIRQLICSFLV